MNYAAQLNTPPTSEFIRALYAANALQGAAEHRVFFSLHDHHILPHHYPPTEAKRRDAILVRRGWDAVLPKYEYKTYDMGTGDFANALDAELDNAMKIPPL